MGLARRQTLVEPREMTQSWPGDPLQGKERTWLPLVKGCATLRQRASLPKGWIPLELGTPDGPGPADEEDVEVGGAADDDEATTDDDETTGGGLTGAPADQI